MIMSVCVQGMQDACECKTIKKGRVNGFGNAAAAIPVSKAETAEADAILLLMLLQ